MTNLEDHDEEIVDSVLPEPNDVSDAMDVTEAGDEISTCENKSTEDNFTGTYSWKINNFSELREKIYSEPFPAGGYSWRVLVFPRGNATECLATYLDVADSNTLPVGWSRTAFFTLTVVNQVDDKYSVKMDSTHQFSQRENDWGFTRFMPLKDLFDTEKGFLVDDSVIINAYVAVKLDYWNYDSKKETGFVGLKNQGATCYLNSLLQTLYHIPYFRKAVYHMPTTEDDIPTKSIPLALQSLFYKLQFSETSVATKELTKSFGWDTYDSFMQHDVQELNRVLCEKLEDKMKGTVVEGTIQKLFEGHHNNFIECINVDFKSTRKESFYDLQLDVKGCKNIYDSFDRYVEIEKLEGDNKYHAEQFGLQDAKKGVTFIDFPPVLQLQLKRFEYDFVRDTMVKINDRYEFPSELDLDREDGKYLSPDADRTIRNLYALHSVLVHSGGIHGGHYYAFIRPTLSGQWYKFDDERVTKEDVRRALDEQYGGEEELPQNNVNNPPFKFTKYSNAYMLVYIRKSDMQRIMCKVQEEDIALHLRSRLKKEQEEKERRKKEKAEAHLYTIIKVATDEDLKQQVGTHIHFDLIDFEKVKSFRVQKQTPFSQFKEDVFKEFNVPVHLQRFWIWAKRQNHTFRPNRPLTAAEESQMVGSLKDISNKAFNEVKLFLETKSTINKEIGDQLYDIPKDEILVFFKLYDPFKEELSYVGRMFIRLFKCPLDYKQKFLEMTGLSSNEDFLLFEEIKFEPNIMCEKIEFKNSFKQCQLENGDIICIQRNPQSLSNGRLKDDKSTIRFPHIGNYFEYIKNRQVVRIRRLDKPKEDSFSLELSKVSNYDDVVKQIAHEIGLDDPKKIRLTTHNCFSQQPKPPSIKFRGFSILSEALIHYNQISDILYYEVLDIPLPDLQNLKSLKINFHNKKTEYVSNHNIRLPKQSTVADVIKELRTKIELSSPDVELRILEVFYHKIFKVFPPTDVIESINDNYWTLRVEEIPEEEKEISNEDKIIHVYHIFKETSQSQTIQNFGDPFFFVLHENETVGQVRERIREKLQVSEEEILKWKFAYVTIGRPEYLEDSAVLMPQFPKNASYGPWEHYLGLEHSNVTPKRSHMQNQSRHGYEKPVKIYN